MLVNLEHDDQSWFFCNFKLETILDILDRGRGVKEEDQWRLADNGRWLTVYLQNFDRMFRMTA